MKVYVKSRFPNEDTLLADLNALLRATATRQTPHELEPERLQDAALTAWLERLPFPLASILWRYVADIRSTERATALLQFFEASSQFLCTVMLSAFCRDDALIIRERGAWRGQSAQPLDMRRSTFGLWVALGYGLAKTLRSLSSTPAGEARCCELLGTDDVRMVRLLRRVDLYALLEQVNRWRNDWIGHGGQPTSQIVDGRLDQLAMQLAAFHNLAGEVFRNKQLLFPLRGELRDGRYTCEAAVLSGSNPHFRVQQVSVREVLESQELYLMDTGSSKALRLCALMKLVEQDTGRGFYFFSRTERGETRWISFDQLSKPEIKDLDERPAQLAALIHP
jgi:hypothetical protein